MAASGKTWLVYGDILNRHVVESFIAALEEAGETVLTLPSLQRSHCYLGDTDLQEQILSRIRNAAEQTDIDVLFNFRASELGPLPMEFLRRRGVACLVWLPDDPLLYQLCYRHVVDLYDIVLHCGHDDVISFYQEKHPGINGFNFPFWSDEGHFHYAYEPENASCDIGFVGNCHTDNRAGRYELLASLPFRVALYGTLPYGLTDSTGIHRGYLAKLEPEVLGKFKIGLSVPQFFRDSEKTEYWFDELAQFESFFFPSRIIQHAGCGVPTISPRTRHSDKIIPSLLTYDSRDDLIHTARRLLGSPETLLAASRAARHDFERHLTATTRVRMLKHLLEKPDERHALLERCDMWKNFTGPVAPAGTEAELRPVSIALRDGHEVIQPQCVENQKVSRMLYARGFLLTKEDVSPHPHWNRACLGDYFISYDPQTPFESLTQPGGWLAVLGRVIDTGRWTMDLSAITKNLYDALERSETDLFDYLDVLSGRYLIIYGTGGRTRILHDAIGMRSIFYHASPTNPVLGSHYRLVADHAGARPSSLVKKEWLTGKFSTLPGHFTPFENVFFLTPNTLLEIEAMEVSRYFPRERLAPSCVEDEADAIADSLRGQLELLNRHHGLGVSLTAGIDSRTTLALAKNIAQDILFFTYLKSNCSPESGAYYRTDLSVARELADNLKLRHLTLEFADAAPESTEVGRTLSKHVFKEHGFQLAAKYLADLPADMLHIRSNAAEIGRAFYRKNRAPEAGLTPRRMARIITLQGCDDDNDATAAFNAWCNTVSFGDLENYDPYDMFYWEHRLGTWHASLLLESDVAHDTFILYNCRSILKKMLSLPFNDRLSGAVFHEIIRRSWPVLEFWPINAVRNKQAAESTDFTDQGITLSTEQVRSGSLLDKEAEIETMVRQDKGQVLFWMRRSDPQEGDFAAYSAALECQAGRGYWTVIEMRSPYSNPQYTGRLTYQTLLNGQVLLEEDIAQWDEVNHITIKWKAGKPANELLIRVVAKKGCETWSWGWAARLIIKRIHTRELAALAGNEITASSPYSTIYGENADSI